MMKLYSILRQIDRAYYYLHYRFRKRQHILRLPLPYTWVDADERMFEACFTILGQYVEEELGRKPYSYQSEDSLYRGYRRHAADGRDEAAIDLWLWYKEELPALEKDYYADLKLRHGKRKYPYDYVETVKDEKLKSLIDLRQALWT